jgi:UDP-N-acetylmuramoyl-tripeptide--D-alanyl-D-alanine ligase
MSQRPPQFAFDGQTAAHATHGHLLVDSPRWTAELCTDSRKLAPGALFVALSGETFDGAEFIGAAIAAGAVGVVAAKGKAAAHVAAAKAAGAWLLEVDDVLVQLGELARNHRQRFSPLVIGITGSNGKTTTKELTALALSPLGKVLWTAGNFNNRIGLPLTLARLSAEHRIAVLEMGMSVPGEIRQLAHIGVPQIGVITSIAEAHLQGMGSIHAIADEKADLLRALPKDGVAIVPADERLLDDVVAALPCRVVRYGRGAGDVKLASPIAINGLAQEFEADIAGTRVAVTLPGLGVHLAHNALAALAVAFAAGADLHAAANALSRYEPVGQRMLPSRIGPWLVLEDCYNANPRSVEVALDTLATLPGPRAAILGSMLELGVNEHELHARVGRHAAAVGADLLIAVGAFAADYARGAASAGITTVTVSEPAEAAAILSRVLPDAGTVLVKGSRGARMERVIAALRDLQPPAAATAPTARS